MSEWTAERIAALKGHTPGPWHVGAVRKYGVFPEGDPDLVRAIAEVAHVDYGPRRFQPQTKEAAADAALIAAAPDMLAEIERLQARERELVAALEGWKCPICHGRKTSMCMCDGQYCRSPEYCNSGGPCRHCEGSGLNPRARQAIAGKGAEAAKGDVVGEER